MAKRKRWTLKIPVSFEEAVSDLLKVKPPQKPEKPSAKARRTPKRVVKKR